MTYAVHDLCLLDHERTEEKQMYMVGQKTDHILKCMTPVYDEVGRRSIYQNVELFIGSKTHILNVAIFKYSWHKFGETILHRKYQLI